MGIKINRSAAGVVCVAIAGMVGALILERQGRWALMAKRVFAGSVALTIGGLSFIATPVKENIEEINKNSLNLKKNLAFMRFDGCRCVVFRFLDGSKSEVNISISKQSHNFNDTNYKIEFCALFEDPIELLGSSFNEQGWGDAVKSLQEYFNVMKID